jgi:hypothetical protein
MWVEIPTHIRYVKGGTLKNTKDEQAITQLYAHFFIFFLQLISRMHEYDIGDFLIMVNHEQLGRQ